MNDTSASVLLERRAAMRENLRRLLFPLLVRLPGLSLHLDRLEVSGRGLERQALGQQEVPGVAARDADDVAALSEVLDLLA